ncbi:dihydrolipoamide acetyltransferase family protein [Devosia sp.]|uniref:dihydrolipoamide acetyltransferase family protein n=1 Tax=Devosia sp. TaxID=1871048 RepID=UPI002FCA8BEA
MSIHVIKMPDLGEGIAEVELVAWRVLPGERVVEDQILADVMTDKATVEIPSPVVGQVLALGGEVGQVLAVGAELIRIEVEAQEAVSPSPAGGGPGWGQPPQAAQAVQAVPATQAGQPPSQPSPREGRSERPIASPAVRRRAWELGIALQQVAATGAGGRIMQADLDAHVAAHGAVHGAGVPAGVRPVQRHDEEQIPVVGLRRRIAQKMQESKRRIPHFTYVEEVDVTELEALRAQLNAKWGAQRGHLTLLPLLVRAMVLAVREFPQINARFDDEAGVVTRHGAVHLGIATQTEAGLMVPVLRHAEAKDLWASAAEVARLAQAARAGKATRDELTGSTLTITSLGALGGIVSTPVINHPEVAIVGVNRIALRPVMRDGVVVARQMMNLSSSFDHRVVDGVDAAQFVQALRGYLESPTTLFVE